MTSSERPTFGADEVIEIASKFETEDAAFIIGGQATNFWAWFYEEREPDLANLGPFTSEDIDYFGSKEIAATVADALGGQLFVPQPGDHTPNTAQIVATFNGKPLRIDFLNSVLGVRHDELEKGVSVLEIDAELDGKPTKVQIKVLHPLLCLKSRIVNILHPATRRKDLISKVQAEGALIILRRFIDDALDDPNGWKDVHSCFRRLFRYLRHDEYVKIADIQTSVDPLTVLKHFADDTRIDHRYRNRNLKTMIAKIEQRRKGRR
jgi:hypothetical protein